VKGTKEVEHIHTEEDLVGEEDGREEKGMTNCRK
jgi:hypothetical protein